MLAASLILIAALFFPLWSITLTAPQYPDGISMFIWIDGITGQTVFTLQNINILNHYIGMKYIVPDEIPEFAYFPYILYALIASGLIISFTRFPKIYLAWGILVALLGALGVYDFYLWEYDYGHNLDPKAPISIPGMAYQPPLIGSKMLLNFKATSLPKLGTFALVIPIVASFLAYRKSNKEL